MNHPESDRLHRELTSVTTPDEAAALGRLGTKLGTVPQPQRSASAHAKGRELLKLHMAPKKQRFTWQWRYTLIPAAGLAAVALIIGLLGLLSHNAVPGQPTYAIKRSLENAQFSLAFSDQSKALDCSTQMKRRANELAILSNKPMTAQTVTDLNNSVLNEAAEFQEYIQASDKNQSYLHQQRTRDIQYVITALNYASSHTNDKQQQSTIAETIETLRSSLQA
jgi:hypothetical protein